MHSLLELCPPLFQTMVPPRNLSLYGSQQFVKDTLLHTTLGRYFPQPPSLGLHEVFQIPSQYQAHKLLNSGRVSGILDPIFKALLLSSPSCASLAHIPLFSLFFICASPSHNPSGRLSTYPLPYVRRDSGQYHLQKWYPMVPLDDSFRCPSQVFYTRIHRGWLVSQPPDLPH
jgi:hypothetical protein